MLRVAYNSLFHFCAAPVTLVDYYRADYPPPAFAPNDNHLYQFYFVFLRERLVGIDGLEVKAGLDTGVHVNLDNSIFFVSFHFLQIIYSRVARICRVRSYIYMYMQSLQMMLLLMQINKV